MRVIFSLLMGILLVGCAGTNTETIISVPTFIKPTIVPHPSTVAAIDVPRNINWDIAIPQNDMVETTTRLKARLLVLFPEPEYQEFITGVLGVLAVVQEEQLKTMVPVQYYLREDGYLSLGVYMQSIISHLEKRKTLEQHWRSLECGLPTDGSDQPINIEDIQ